MPKMWFDACHPKLWNLSTISCRMDLPVAKITLGCYKNVTKSPPLASFFTKTASYKATMIVRKKLVTALTFDVKS